MNLLTLYAMFVLPSLGVFLCFVALMGFFALFIYVLPLKEMSLEPEEWSSCKKILGGIAITMALGLAIPSENAMRYIVGGYAVTNIEGVKDLPPNIIKAANQFLENLEASAEEE